MRSWFLAAVAALGIVGQAEARTITFISGDLKVTEACYTGYAEDCSTGTGKTPRSIGVLGNWTAEFSFDENQLVFHNGLAVVDYPTVLSVSGTAGGARFKTSNPDRIYNIGSSVTVDLGLNPISWLISLEAYVGSLWYLDTGPDGRTSIQIWSRDDLSRFYQYDNYREEMTFPHDHDISPVPLPAAAPLLGAALIGLWARRRRA